MNQQIALLTGGNNSEREVALKSAENVRKALEVNFDVQVFDFPRDLPLFISKRSDFSVAVPVFHGKGGEDGVIQGFLETLEIPYVFSGVEAHAIGMDKAMCKRLVRADGVKTADWVLLKRSAPYTGIFPVVAKPVNEGSSHGVQIIQDEESLQTILSKEEELLIEEYIEGREFTVAVIQTDAQPQALPVIEIRSKNAFFDYESKYNATLCDEICPAQIDQDLAIRLQEMALRVHTLIHARHLTRTDMIVDHAGEIWFLEINTIPGLTSESLTPKAIQAEGLNLVDLLKTWINDVIKKTA